MKKYYLICFTVMLFLIPAHAIGSNETLAHQMASLHEKILRKDPAFLNTPVEPADAAVSEFQWILDSMKNRCLNPEGAIADTIYGVWTSLREKGKDMTLLDVARELSLIARNTKLFGTDKVNFRMTSQSWYISKTTGIDIETVIKSNIFDQ